MSIEQVQRPPGPEPERSTITPEAIHREGEVILERDGRRADRRRRRPRGPRRKGVASDSERTTPESDSSKGASVDIRV